MNKRVLNNRGLTLVELLAVTVLFGIIAIFVGSLIIKSSETTKEIQIETHFRDEADLIMSNFIKTMYETKQSNIIQFVNDTENSYLKVTNDPSKCERDENGDLRNESECNKTIVNIGFIKEDGKTKLYLKDEEYVVSNQNITILPDSKIIENKDGTYEIILNLQYKSVRGGNEVLKNMDFKNTIRPF